LFELQRSAITDFLPLNLLFFGAIALIWFSLEFGLKKDSRVRAVVDRFVNSSIYLLLVWSIFIGAAGRLVYASFQFGAGEIDRIAQKVDQIKETRTEKTLLSSPVEFLYVSDKQVSAAFEQLRPELKLKERTIGLKDAGSVSANATVAEIASAGGALSRESETKDTYENREKTPVGKSVYLINELYNRGQLSEVKPIEIQSDEVASFDRAAALLQETYGVPLPTERVDKVRDELLAKTLSRSMRDKFPMNSWVVVTGQFLGDREESAVRLRFDYAPSSPQKVFFTCVIPFAGETDNHLRSLEEHRKWSLSVFGKLVHRHEADGMVEFGVNCYAVYR
jgi:hypothetical protein